MDLGLTDRAYVVTGGLGALGRRVAERLVARGARHLVLVGRTASAPPELEADVRVVVADVADRAAVASMVERVLEAFGTLDVLVCNAGTNVRNRSLEALSPADWDLMIATNLTGAFNLVHFVLPAMRAQGSGLVVQIASVSAKRASVLGGAGYSASKFGQAALGICLAREEGAHGIRSTVIYPGEVNTPILDARPVPVGAERKQEILQPEDVAAAVRFLVELNPRAQVPELIIKPTVDDYS